MNYITSCPKCDTHFLISTEHLKAQHGKVQCGHCEHVFNAKNRLKEASEETLEALHEAQQEESVQETIIVLDEAKSDEPVNVETITYEAPLTEETAQTPAPEPYFLEDLTINPSVSKKKFKLHYGLLSICLLLALLMAFQLVYFSRTKLAAQYPQYKPLLSQACELLNCKIDLPKNLDLLVIDDSDMQEDQDYQDVVNFSSTVINNASYTQAYPNLELTLTNADDHPVLRKIIKPAEYLGANDHLETGLGSHEETHIRLAIHTGDIAVSGYRVQLIY
jgi:predicted Zn finger-like uncharacterized protein